MPHSPDESAMLSADQRRREVAAIRHLRSLGAECLLVAPSKMPRRPGDRMKNGRRDAATLERLQRAGELTAVWVPEAESEASSGDRARPERRRSSTSGFPTVGSMTSSTRSWLRT